MPEIKCICKDRDIPLPRFLCWKCDKPTCPKHKYSYSDNGEMTFICKKCYAKPNKLILQRTNTRAKGKF